VIQQGSDLLKNVLLFSKILRSRKVGITTDNILDALRGTAFIDIQKKSDFYHLLKSNYVSKKEEIQTFNEVFESFWSLDDDRGLSPKNKGKEANSYGEEERILPSQMGDEGRLLLQDWMEGEENEGKDERVLGAYSPEEILRQKNFGQLHAKEVEEIREFVLSLSQKMAMNLSRRWKRSTKGNQLDFRRSFRQSIKYGGEMIELRRRERKLKPLRVILLCDVSGSMDIYTQFFLLFIYGLQNHYPYCETFVFSTRLSHVSFLLKRRAFEEALRLISARVLDWSGGTNIGGALHQLHHRHGHLLHPDRTLFLIFSDGWDRGDSALLNAEMRQLKRQVKRLIWLNPLLGTLDYQPLCKGMATALPYLDHFLPCHNFNSLKRLAAQLSKILPGNS
jgi:uncharacterized protein with von Willebrand factor type A (vWA) domain